MKPLVSLPFVYFFNMHDVSWDLLKTGQLYLDHDPTDLFVNEISEWQDEQKSRWTTGMHCKL